MLDGDDLHVEATRDDNYVDAGATCQDLVDGNLNRNVRVSGDVVNLAVPGAYHIKYDCTNIEGVAAWTAERVVYVQDNTCPWCVVKPGPEEIEASFPYADPGADCFDSVDGKIDDVQRSCVGENDSACTGADCCTTDGLPDVYQTGTYTITYSVTDSAGNSNTGLGTNCRGPAAYTRTIQVIDSLKPVLALKLADGSSPEPYTVAMSPQVDESAPVQHLNAAGEAPMATMVRGTDENGAVTWTQTEPYRPGTAENPNLAYEDHPAYPVANGLMAETAQSNGAAGLSWVVFGAIASVVGVALVVFGVKRQSRSMPEV